MESFSPVLPAFTPTLQEIPQVKFKRKERWYPDYYSKESLTAQVFFERKRRNLDTASIFIGPRGSGKSWACLYFGVKFDPNFNATDNVFFRVQDYVRWVNNNIESVGNIEEVSILASNRNWYEKQNAVFSDTMTLVRYRKNYTNMNLPNLKHLDARNLPLVHYIFKTLGQGRLRCYSINTSDFSGKIFPYLYEVLNVPTPPKHITDVYEARAAEWKKQHVQENLDMLEQFEQPYQKRFSVKDYLRLYKVGLMEDVEVNEILTQMGYNDRQVDLMLRLQHMKLNKPDDPDTQDKIVYDPMSI